MSKPLKATVKRSFCKVVQKAEVSEIDVEFGQLKAKFYDQQSFAEAKQVGGFIYGGLDFRRANIHPKDMVIYFLFHKS
jgi:hypothetical protein